MRAGFLYSSDQALLHLFVVLAVTGDGARLAVEQPHRKLAQQRATGARLRFVDKEHGRAAMDHAAHEGSQQHSERIRQRRLAALVALAVVIEEGEIGQQFRFDPVHSLLHLVSGRIGLYPAHLVYQPVRDEQNVEIVGLALVEVIAVLRDERAVSEKDGRMEHLGGLRQLAECLLINLSAHILGNLAAIAFFVVRRVDERH